MNIIISSGYGNGKTEIAAFDEALNNAGLSNLNLIYLSSVIPQKAHINLKKKSPKYKHGDKAYVVLAKNISKNNKKISAGLGWVQEKKSGEGLFVEIIGENKAKVIKDIKETLKHMKKLRKKDFGPINYEIKEANCKQGYNCVIVIALYQIESWDLSKNR